MATSRIDGSLSPDVFRCLHLLAEGKSIPEIAVDLETSEATILEIIEAARDGLGARNSVHAVNIAIRKELI